MTQISAICMSYLKGEKNSIMTAFQKFNCTNLPRENGRSVERKFNVKLEKKPKKFISTYGRKGEYFEYSLPKKGNEDGIKKMIQYVRQQTTH